MATTFWCYEFATTLADARRFLLVKYMEKIKIKDNSGDKEFFTIVPNFIINHSTANDRALYLEMKRFAGEDGKCFATVETMTKRLGIGNKAFNKSLDYLLKRGWISYTGKTKGKTHPINTYKINNIWQENSDYFKKIAPERDLSFEKIAPESKGDSSQKKTKIAPESTVEEEPYKEEKEEDNTAEQGSADIVSLIDSFKVVNPSYKRLFSNITQRKAMERLLKDHGKDNLLKIINFLPKSNSTPYMPIITTPLMLESKFGQLAAAWQKIKNNQPIIL